MGETNVIRGLRGWSVNSTYSGGPVFLSTSTSATTVGLQNGIFLPTPKGVQSTYFGITPTATNIGAFRSASYSIIP